MSNSYFIFSKELEKSNNDTELFMRNDLENNSHSWSNCPISLDGRRVSAGPQTQFHVA